MGKEINWMAGKYVGLLYPRLLKLAENFYVVDARKVVVVVASAIKQHLSALHFVSVADNAFKIIQPYA